MNQIMPPFYVKNTSCLENLLCIILSSKNNDMNTDCMQLFMDHWYMNYDPSYKELGDRVKFFDDYMIHRLLQNAEDFYGMKVTLQETGGKFDYDKLTKLLNENEYVILCIDAFKLKNLALYNKHHVQHYVLVKGIEKEGIRCIDYSDEILIDIDHYNAGAIHYQVLNSCAPRFTKVMWPGELHKRLTKLVAEKEVFQRIRLLADDLDDSEMLYVELNNVSKNDVLILRIPNSLQAIGASRYHVRRAITNIESIPHTAELAEKELSEIEQEWFSMIKRIIKFKFNHKAEVIHQVRQDIYKLADREEELAGKLLMSFEKETENYDGF